MLKKQELIRDLIAIQDKLIDLSGFANNLLKDINDVKENVKRELKDDKDHNSNNK